MNLEQMKQRLKALAGPKATVKLRCLLRGKRLPIWGNLRTTKPFSEYFGFDRGTPVDRYYLHRFLEQKKALITGDVLEIQMPGYTTRYGTGLRKTDSVDINPDHDATYICDLAESQGIIPDNHYDCFLLPNTLCVLKNIEGCLTQALRVIKPGGVILATTAAFMPLNPDSPDYWRLTADGWKELAKKVWPGCEIEIESHGNCLVAVAAMLGLAVEELSEAEMEVSDSHYPVLVTLLCRKPVKNE